MSDKQKNKPVSKKKNIIITIIALVVLFAILSVVAYKTILNREKFVFADHLEDTVVKINGEILTFEDLSFYVLYEENVVEKEAKVYNSESTKDYWNLHLNGHFVSDSAKDSALQMAIHDRIMYNLASKNNMTLTEEERTILANKQKDFWEDLFDYQLSHLPTSKEYINATMEEIALGEKYQEKLTKEKDVNYFEYNFDGNMYKEMLEKDYKIEVNEDLWKKVTFGDITLKHDKVNYINGLTDQMKEALNSKK